MKFENVKVYNIEDAMRGMRNPLNSWAKGDTVTSIGDVDKLYELVDVACGDYYTDEEWSNLSESEQDIIISKFANNICVNVLPDTENLQYYLVSVGPNDMDLAKRLIAGGSEHRKFLRQIFVSVDITAPLYWWKEFDTYKISTAANSTSTMHKLASKPITLDCFDTDDFDAAAADIDNVLNPDTIIKYCETLRQKYLETKDTKYWKELVRWLPEGWLQTRTWTGNYENLRTMYHQRSNHKLTEWHQFCDFVKTLPYADDFIIN